MHRSAMGAPWERSQQNDGSPATAVHDHRCMQYSSLCHGTGMAHVMYEHHGQVGEVLMCSLAGGM